MALVWENLQPNRMWFEEVTNKTSVIWNGDIRIKVGTKFNMFSFFLQKYLQKLKREKWIKNKDIYIYTYLSNMFSL